MSDKDTDSKPKFKDLNICMELRKTCRKLKYFHPTPIQLKSIPHALNGKDLICASQTGSGKTLAFILPILQKFIEEPHSYFALILTPTRELALQTAETIETVGKKAEVKAASIIGGLSSSEQKAILKEKPHIIVGTPGRIVDFLDNTNLLKLEKIKFLVFDEADRLLSMDFENDIKKIIEKCPESRSTYLFSATMTSGVKKLKNYCLKKDAVKIDLSNNETVETLTQKFAFLPFRFKDTYLVHIIEQFSKSSIIIFTATNLDAKRLEILLQQLSYKAIALYGKLTQKKRIKALNRFKNSKKNILIATDVASRGIDIPEVELIVNYDVPTKTKNYIHRVGRTARAGLQGNAITMVSQYDIQNFQRIEESLEIRMEEYLINHAEAMKHYDEITLAESFVAKKIEDEKIDSEDSDE
ncbi:unnamed protein product [Blepharisma stoltei]|uniref:RNA helicase n=1 Tax=Blepharisma stoltei TaxID=1481888 RepID=A0AAU9JJ05_9CILI|nr:unnamed protein product [Blepharisma stoltei]